MKIIVILFFTVCVTIGGTSSQEPVYGDHVDNPKVYYEDEETYELVEQVPNKIDREFVHLFFKNDHIENVKIDAEKDIKMIFANPN